MRWDGAPKEPSIFAACIDSESEKHREQSFGSSGEDVTEAGGTGLGAESGKDMQVADVQGVIRRIHTALDDLGVDFDFEQSAPAPGTFDLWIQSIQMTPVGVTVSEHADTARLMCGRFTFEPVPVSVVPEFVSNLVSGRVDLRRKKGPVRDILSLTVRVGGEDWEVSRGVRRDDIDDWESRLLKS